LDIDNDGNVTKEEFKYRLVDTDYEQMEMNPQLLQNRVKAVIKEIKLAIFQQDSNIEEIYQVICQKNKEMQLDQFVSFLKQIHSELSQYEMEITFKQFDKDASGTISKDEFFEALTGEHYDQF
jgi:Ca2+-binding EF-hand superfamily protein